MLGKGKKGLIWAGAAVAAAAVLFFTLVLPAVKQKAALEDLKAQAEQARETLDSGDVQGALSLYSALWEQDLTALPEQTAAEVWEGTLLSLDKSIEEASAEDVKALSKTAAALYKQSGDSAFLSALQKRESYLEAMELQAQGQYARAAASYGEAGDFLQAKALQRDCLDRELAEKADAALSKKDFPAAEKLIAQVASKALTEQLQERLLKEKTLYMASLAEKYKNRLCTGAWYTLVWGDQVFLQGDRRYDALTLPEGCESLYGGAFGVLALSQGKAFLLGDSLGASKELETIDNAVSGAVGYNHVLLLLADGSVTAAGALQYGKGEVGEWKDITAVAAGAFHSLGLQKDGAVLAAGDNSRGQCAVEEWSHITAIACGMNHSVGLCADGTVVAAGDNTYGQCNVSEWKNIRAVACGANHTLGITEDYRVVAVGDDSAGQCETEGWQGAVTVSGGAWHTVAILADGSVAATGGNGCGQCSFDTVSLFESHVALEHSSPKAGEECEYVFVGDDYAGPWLYLGDKGAVLCSIENSYSLVATRADLFCRYGVTPLGILSGGGDKPRSTASGPLLARQNSAVFAMTGDYYTFEYNADGIQLRRGAIAKNEGNAIGFAFFPDGTMGVVDPATCTAEELLSQGIRDSWVFGPLLIKDGQALDVSWNPLSFNAVTLRCAMGSVCAHHHVAIAAGKGTLADITQLFLDYGCTIAYNLDGGRSVSMTFMGKRINRTYFDDYGTRNLQDMIGFLTSDLVPD